MTKEKNPDSKASSNTSDVPQTPSKRRAVRQILTGGGVIGVSTLGGNWKKPVLDSVVLPSHAATTATRAPTRRPTRAPTRAPGATQAPAAN